MQAIKNTGLLWQTTMVIVAFVTVSATAVVHAETLKVDIGVLHFEVGSQPSEDGGTTTVVEGGYRTGAWNDRMRIEDTEHSDGSRTVIQERESGPAYMQKKEIERYSVPHDEE